jgi:hypothetical protein
MGVWECVGVSRCVGVSVVAVGPGLVGSGERWGWEWGWGCGCDWAGAGAGAGSWVGAEPRVGGQVGVWPKRLEEEDDFLGFEGGVAVLRGVLLAWGESWMAVGRVAGDVGRPVPFVGACGGGWRGGVGELITWGS